MKRRTFFANTLKTALATSIPFSPENIGNQYFIKRMQKPERLTSGATIALITPASPPAEIKFQKAYDNLAAMGFRIKPGKNMRAQYGYLAGSDEQRVDDIHTAFTDPEVDAVWCVRGGYGCTRLLPLLDYDLIRKHNKPLIGYSDITALHVALQQRAGIVSFHGQVGGGDMTPFTLGHIQGTLFSPSSPYLILPLEEELRQAPEYQPFMITAGKASGKLTGGNLAVLTALAGTPFVPEFKKKIAFIEDIGEAPYRIDRMLTQLLQATDLREAAGIVLGIFTDCEQKGYTPSLRLADTLRDRLAGLGIPVYYGAPFGHISDQCVLPYGIDAAMDASAMTLTLLETAVR